MNSKTVSILVILAAVIIGSGGLWLYQANNEEENKDSIVRETDYRKEITPQEKNEKDEGENREEVSQKKPVTSAVSEEDDIEPKISSKDEKATGYIKALYKKQGKNYLDIDYIQYFDGKDAIKAIKEDKKSSGYNYSEDIPNGFYIRNNNPKIRTFQISNDVLIKIRYEFETSSTGEKTVSYEEFKNKFDSKNLYKEIPVDIGIKDGVVADIIQKFIP